MAASAPLRTGLLARLAGTATLLVFLAVQPWIVCPLTCLAGGHGLPGEQPSGHAGHHHVAQPCHHDQVLRADAGSVQPLDTMYPAPTARSAGSTPVVDVTIEWRLPSLSHRRPSTDPPPPRAV
jgi:hypothetical protein